jgi:hypothetical protein
MNVKDATGGSCGCLITVPGEGLNGGSVSRHRLLSTKQITAFTASFRRIIKRNGPLTKLKTNCQ